MKNRKTHCIPVLDMQRGFSFSTDGGNCSVSMHRYVNFLKKNTNKKSFYAIVLYFCIK